MLVASAKRCDTRNKATILKIRKWEDATELRRNPCKRWDKTTTGSFPLFIFTSVCYKASILAGNNK